MNRTSQKEYIDEFSNNLALVLILIMLFFVVSTALLAFELGETARSIQIYERQTNRP